MFRRWIVLVMVSVALMILSGTMLAQDDCGLTVEDCAFLAEFDAVMGAVQSAAFNVETEFGVDYLMLPEPVTLRAVLNGAYMLQETDETDSLLRLINGVNADVNVIIDLADLRDLLPYYTQSSLLTFDTRLVEGVGYLNLDKVAAMDYSGSTPTGWYGVDLIAFYRALLDVAGFRNNPPELVERTPIIVALEEINTLQRLEDSELNGQSMAVFDTGIIFADVLADSDQKDRLIEGLLLTLREQFGGFYSEQELAEIAESYADLFTGTTFHFTRTIGLDDHYLHRAEISFVYTPNSTAVFDLLSTPDPLGFSALYFDLCFDFALNLTRFNTMSLTTVPEDAVIVPMDELLPGYDAGGAGF
ncbi:MAG: hypothetical protein H7Y09_10270 [Chitinophagaceae bacterium]|nr:hypothetical protein [Anaerolineae bacterium]